MVIIMKIIITSHEFANMLTNLRLEILRALIENNGMTQKELAQKLNISESALSQNLKILENLGLINRKKTIINDDNRFKNVKYVYYNEDNQIIEFSY